MHTRKLTTLLVFLLLLTVGYTNATAQSITAAGYTFTASSKTYTYLTGGTVMTNVQQDDGYSTIPIGFPFRFCGTVYNDVTVCSNGWVRFGTGPGVAPANWNSNPTASQSPYPAVYVLYEDISLAGGNATYAVTGASPNRVLTIELKNIRWDYLAASACASAQVKLYEGTNVIECLYQKESGSVALNSSGGSTIGIHNTVSDYQTLNNTTAAPVSSSSVWTSNLSVVPVTGQSYVWDPGPICPAPTGLTTTNISSTGVTFNWTLVAGNYEYIIDQTVTDPTTSGTANTGGPVTVNGLKPATNYYIHLRYKCSSSNVSVWVTYGFITLPECSVPGKISVSQLDSNSVTFQWPALPVALQYQYLINNVRTNPGPVDLPAVTTQSNSVVSKTGLNSATWYYVHYRILCAGNDSSGWALDSFRTPTPCRRPVLVNTTLSHNNSITTWAAVPTAYRYEYYLGAPASIPPNGTPVYTTYVQTPFLLPSTSYTMNVRCNCNDYNILSNSSWESLDFTTSPPLEVGNIAKENTVIQVYPNPVKNTLYVKSAQTLNTGATITLLDLNGKLLNTLLVNKETTEVNVNDLAPGIYMVRYKSATATETIRFTKE